MAFIHSVIRKKKLHITLLKQQAAELQQQLDDSETILATAVAQYEREKSNLWQQMQGDSVLVVHALKHAKFQENAARSEWARCCENQQYLFGLVAEAKKQILHEEKVLEKLDEKAGERLQIANHDIALRDWARLDEWVTMRWNQKL